MQNMKKILFIGAKNYSIGPWISLWSKNFKKKGFETKIFDHRDIVRIFGINPKDIHPKIHNFIVKKMNEKLKNTCIIYKPDLLFCMKGDMIYPSTISKIRDMGIKTLLWAPDDPQLFNQFSRPIAARFDFILTSSEMCIEWYKHMGCKNVKYLPFMCDPEVHKKICLTDDEKSKYGSDICFIGSYSEERERFFKNISGYDFKIFGWRWNSAEKKVRKFWTGQSVGWNEITKVINASKIVLNVHTAEMKYGGMKSNLRSFETTGCKSFLLTDKTNGLSDLFKLDKEIAVFQTPKEMVNKIDYYLANVDEREKISENGQKRSYKDHTYEKRVEQVLDFIS